MVKTAERNITQGDEALRIINEHRDVLGGNLCVEEIDREFPYTAMDLMHEFGARGLFLARADDNEAGTFKLRGAFVGTYRQKEQGIERRRLHSAGNFASGAAYSGVLLEMETHIFVPGSAPFEKREGLYRFGRQPLLHIYPVGTTLEDAEREMMRNKALGKRFHPFNDPDVISGQGTIADDLLYSLPDVQRVVVPVGGGGLLAGMRQRLDELERPDVILHAIEAEGSNSMSQSLQRGYLMEADSPNLRYGGSAVKKVGDLTLRTCMAAGERIQLSYVTDDKVDNLIGSYQQSRNDLWRKETSAYEPTTLVAMAGLRDIVKRYPDDIIAVIGTGHNAPLPEYI